LIKTLKKNSKTLRK